VLEELDVQMVVVGEGDTAHMKLFQDLQNEFPHRVAAHLKFDSSLPHPVFAGADALLVPSRFEPSGLTQIEAMHYGAIPIVRRTGGLADTVVDATAPDGTGFVFQKADSIALLIALVRAYEAFQSKPAWGDLQVRAMEKDFSWKKSAREYEQLVVKAMQMPSVVLDLE
jgi:starch synthase